MRKLLLLTLVAAAACGGTQTLKDQQRDAMPSSDTMAMKSPQTANSSSANTTAAGVQTDSTAGVDKSIWAATTLAVGATFNVGTAWVLDLLTHTVEDNDPTSCDANSCTWGPGSNALDPNTYKLVVTKSGDGFDYQLSAQPKSPQGSAFITFLTGHATPGAQRHHGSGNFTIDFDQAAKLNNPHNDTGQLAVTYTNVGPLQVTAAFTGARDSNVPTQRNNLAYTYANDTQGGGDLDVAVHNTTTDNRFSMHSRWKNDGQGRADVESRGSSNGAPYDAHLSECWGAAPFTVVYFQSDVSAVFGPNSGTESSCAYQPAAYSQKQVQ